MIETSAKKEGKRKDKSMFYFFQQSEKKIIGNKNLFWRDFLTGQ